MTSAHLDQVLKGILVLLSDQLPESLVVTKAVGPEVGDLLYDLVALLVQGLPLHIVLLLHLQHLLARLIIHLPASLQAVSDTRISFETTAL